MTLQDLRKLAIKQRLEIRFPLKNGRECVVTHTGLAQVPGLHGPPDFNLEEELSAASEFLVDSLAQTDKKGVPARRKLTAAELLAMAVVPAGAAAAGHDEE